MTTLVSNKTGLPLSEVSADEPVGFGLGLGRFHRKELGGAYWFYEGETLGFRTIFAYWAATTRATTRDRTNRETHVVTRRRLRLRYAATPPFQRMPQSAPCVWISGKLLSPSRSRFPSHHPPGDESDAPSRRQPPNRAGCATTPTA
jgi:hypothetical protein